MEAVYRWVRNITFFMIFMTVLNNLLPNAKYEKYVRFFAGIILILLVIQPFTGTMRLDQKIAYYFEAITFQKEADDFKKELWGMEEKRVDQVLDQYEQAVCTDLKGMAQEAGFGCREVQVQVEGDRDSQWYGRVVSIRMSLCGYETEGGAKGPDQPAGVRKIPPMEPVDPVHVETGERKQQKTDRDGDIEGTPEQEENLQEQVNGFRRKVAEYYGLETQQVEIQWEDD